MTTTDTLYDNYGKEWRLRFHREMTKNIDDFGQDYKLAIRLSKEVMQWELSPKDVFNNFVSELQEYIRTKLTPITKKDGTIRWTCGYSHKDEDTWYRRFANLRTFCEERFFDDCVVIDMIEEHSGRRCYCECMIANNLKVKQ